MTTRIAPSCCRRVITGSRFEIASVEHEEISALISLGILALFDKLLVKFVTQCSHFGHGRLRQPAPIYGLGVACDFLQTSVASNRRNLMCAASGFG